MATLDVLGEDVTRREETEQTVVDYQRALAAIAERGLDSNISVKLTALGLKLDPAECRGQFARIVEAARSTGNFVRIDMEDSSVTEETIRIFLEFRQRYEKVGLVLQAYLRRSAADARQYAISDFAAELLPVVDNLQRALAAADDQPQKTPGEDALLGGVRATQRLLTAILERFGVRKIDALGAPFDPMQHEAMTEVDDESRPPRSVVGVPEDGYTIHDRLLRPARVIVSKARPESPPESETASDR